MIKITGLYKSTSKKGETFLSGKSLEGVKYFVFKNNKTKDSHPDYNLYMEGEEPKEVKPSIQQEAETKQEVNDDFPW